MLILVKLLSSIRSNYSIVYSEILYLLSSIRSNTKLNRTEEIEVYISTKCANGARGRLALYRVARPALHILERSTQSVVL